MERPFRKARARLLYLDNEQFGNPGEWHWIEDRPQIRVCMPCRVVYPPSASPVLCPRHGPTVLINSERFALPTESSG